MYLHQLVVNGPDLSRVHDYLAGRQPQLGAEVVERTLAIARSSAPGVTDDQASDAYAQSMDWVVADALGPRDGFGLLHEMGHWLIGAQGICGAVLQERRADAVHTILGQLANLPEPAADPAGRLWKEFERANLRLLWSIERFRPLEEVAANYLAFLLQGYRHLVASSDAVRLPGLVGSEARDRPMETGKRIAGD